VDRNRLKRRLRELVRTELLPSLRTRSTALDVTVRAPSHAYRAEFSALQSDLRGVATRLSTEP
jgi:ribonuclease P protein component